MAEVFLCPKDQLTEQARTDLREAGIVVVEVDDPSRCKFIRSTETVSTSDMVWAALTALNHKGGNYNRGEEQREQFTINLLTVLNAARNAPAGPVEDRAEPEPDKGEADDAG